MIEVFLVPGSSLQHPPAVVALAGQGSLFHHFPSLFLYFIIHFHSTSHMDEAWPLLARACYFTDLVFAVALMHVPPCRALKRDPEPCRQPRYAAAIRHSVWSLSLLAGNGVLTFYLILNLAPSHFFLPLLVITLLLARARRNVLLVNACITWIITGLVSCILLVCTRFFP